MRIPNWKWPPGIERGRIIMTVTNILLITIITALAISLVLVANFKNSCDNSISDYPTASALVFDPEFKPIVDNEARHKKGEDAICLTPGCVHTASKILQNINPEIEPCDDFFKFACGGFVESTPVPDDKISIDSYDFVSDKVLEQLRASIEEPSSRDEPRPFKLAKNLYRTCMNTSAIENAGVKPLYDILEKLGKWPVLEGNEWKEDDFNWMKTVYQLRRLGYPSNYFISLGIDTEWKNNTKRIITLDQPSFDVLPRDFVSKGFENNLVKIYFQYMIDIAVLLGANQQRATQELKESLEFEIKLANISLPDEKRRNFTLLNNPMTIAELGKHYPSVNWEEYINNLLPRSVRVNADEVVRVLVPSFMSGFEDLLRNTPKRVQANYILWRATAVSVSLLSENLRQRELEYAIVLYGKSGRSLRWKECLNYVSQFMSISTGALYVRNYFQEDAKKNAVEIVDNIKKEFTEILKKAEWMDKKTRNKALEKAESMSSHIAYPVELLDDKKLEEFYVDLEFSPNNFLENTLNLTRFLIEYSFKNLREPVNINDWITHGSPAVVNTYYMFTENSIQLPAGILQGNFFSHDRPRYMNYGAIGFLIGHEITHGFDNKGSQFDKDGNLVDWWDPETKKKFLDKAECFIHQYGNYTVEAAGLNVDGVYTQGENIADNGGIKAVYLAYKKWVKRNGPEPKLPGLKYTPEQMFWISAASIWCIKYRPDTALYELTNDLHSPKRFRVIGSLSNMPEFAADFNCPAGSAMNPVRKCSVW